MTREDYLKEILELSDDHKYLMLNLATGVGKSRIAIEVIRRHYENKLLGCNVLIVVPKNVLKDNWKEELEKWDFPQNINVQFTTYISYPKYADTYWDVIILDEGHHFTENCEAATDLFQYDRVLVLSATIPREPKWRLRGCFRGIYEYAVNAREAIDSKILPDPKVLLIPMMLDNLHVDQTYIKRKSKGGTPITLSYAQRRLQFSYPNKQVQIRCTAQQYYSIISDEIDWLQKSYQQTQQFFKKNLWLHTCKDRLIWLASQKESYVNEILKMVDSYRTLTFCNSIEQTERFSGHAVNSKDKKVSMKNLADFNAGNINHITSVSLLDEGMNLSSCQIGIYAYIGASETAEIQKLGK